MYVAFFVVIGISALLFINVVQGPADAMDDPDYDLALDDNVTIDGTEYTLGSVSVATASLNYMEDEVDQTQTLEADAAFNVSGVEYRLEVPDTDAPENVTLVETFPEHDLPTTEDDEGRTLVRVEVDGQQQWLLEEEYLTDQHGERDRIELAPGDTFELDDVNATATVDAIRSNGITVSYAGPGELQVIMQDGDTVEIDGTTYGVHIVGEDRVQLQSDVDAFENHLDALDLWTERHQGFWGVGVLSIFAAVLLGGLSMLPRRG